MSTSAADTSPRSLWKTIRCSHLFLQKKIYIYISHGAWHLEALVCSALERHRPPRDRPVRDMWETLCGYNMWDTYFALYGYVKVWYISHTETMQSHTHVTSSAVPKKACCVCLLFSFTKCASILMPLPIELPTLDWQWKCHKKSQLSLDLSTKRFRNETSPASSNQQDPIWHSSTKLRCPKYYDNMPRS